MRFYRYVLVLLALALMACTTACTSASAEDAALNAANYIENKGSDTMVNLALAWAEAYQKTHPDIRLSVTGGGTGTGLAALINGTVDIANASRAIKKEEIEQARANKIEPTELVVARDAIAVIVNPHNPVEKLTIEQISKIYRGEFSNWKEVGGEDRPIVRLSRETNSGTHVYFLEEVIRMADKKSKEIFSADTLLLPSSEGIISEVRDNPNAIGYDGLGYVTAEVKMVAVARKAEDGFFIPSAKTVNDNKYPISRDLYMYTAGKPDGALKDYLDWLFTPEAQKIVTDLGFVPLVNK